MLAQSDDGTSTVDDVATAVQQAQISGWDVVAAVAVLILAIPVGSIVRRAVRRGLGRVDSVPSILADDVARFSRFLVYVIALGIALSVLGVDVAWIALITIFAMIIVVLTLRPVIENTAAALVLTMRPAFGVGDEITVGEWNGTVLEIGSHSTVLKTVDGVRIHIPNTTMLGQTVSVLTAFDARRAEFDFSLPGGTDLKSAASCVIDALSNVENVLGDPAPQTIISKLDQDAIIIEVRFWDPSSMASSAVPLGEAMEAVSDALVAAGIEPGGPSSALSITGRLDTQAEDADGGETEA